MSSVVAVKDDDGTVCEALKWLKPDYFVNGGDRTAANEAEHEVCKELGIRELFSVGGDKIASSSALVDTVCDEAIDDFWCNLGGDE